MFKGLMRWMGSKADKTPKRSEPFIQEPASVDEFKGYLKAEIYKSPFVKTEARERVLANMLTGQSLKAPGVSTDEKKRLGLNARLKITQAHLDDLAPEAFAIDPKKVVAAIYHRAFHKHARRSELARKRNAGITAYRPASVKDQRECSWCLGMSGKIIPITQDFDDLAEGNCTCEYCRCCLIAHIPGVT
ncbi:hypothetical protein PS914_05329 [Pseudomonas fluorescens]|uniref:hypothetical protein n=1 Tax=Pseudomonas fluorescens TaxID=294 RepID=UPI001242E39D|nr:hypothetical protein [Pseudomonas fluorescens]VVQ12215.1 hypothetical protein PS914_05329 [Pseudomonas fluorescens]